MTVSLIANQCMLWGGEDVPCAQILLMSLGGLDADVNAKICDCEGYMIGYDGMTF